MPFVRACIIAGLFAVPALALAGETAGWRPYLDIDGTLRHIAFTEQTTAFESGKPLEKRDLKNFQGYAQVKTGNDGHAADLGYLSVLVNGHGVGMATIFKTAGKSLNPQRPEDAKQLAQARAFDFYEFGMGRLGHAQFSARDGICRSFQSGRGVELAMSTNYYPQNSYTTYYTSHIRALLKRDAEPQMMAYRAFFTGGAAALQQEMRDQESRHGQRLAADNAREKATILLNVVCRGESRDVACRRLAHALGARSGQGKARNTAARRVCGAMKKHAEQDEAGLRLRR